MILGIDPGSEETAYALINDFADVLKANKVPNKDFRAMLRLMPYKVHVVIESIQSYGMTVGKEVFQTCYEIGRILEICERNHLPVSLYPRPEYAKAICGVQKVNDAVLRQSLLLRFGGDRKGEPLHLLKGNSDKRSAFAVAAYHLDKMRQL